MRTQPIIHTLIAAALLGLPTAALADQDQNTNRNNTDNRQQQRQAQTPQQQQARAQQQATWQAQHAQQSQQRTQSQQTWQNNNNTNRADQRAQSDQRARDEQIREQQRINAQRNVNNGGYYNNGTYNNGAYNGSYNNGQFNNGQYNNGQGQLTGVVSAFSNFNLQLNNNQNIQLHQGTVINPTGTTLRAGMQVQIYGRNNGNGTFEADTINVVNGNNGQYNNGSLGGLGAILRGIGL